LLIHGLTGCEDSVYLRQTARCFLQAGACVIRANLRGAGPLRGEAKEHYNGGRSEDLVEIIDGVLAYMPDATLSGLWVIGYSLGGNLLLKLLGEGREPFWPIAGAVSVSAPIAMKRCQLRMMEPRNSLYQRYLLDRMKADAPGVSEAAKRRIKSVWQFDEEIVAPAGGFGGAEDYYAKSSANQYLGDIRTPTLLLSADNDPWIPKEMYETGDWRSNPSVTTVITRGGGHVGFHGTGSRLPWHSRAALAFLKAEGG
jgi:predicted alpha/beta-fold hydrolase